MSCVMVGFGGCNNPAMHFTTRCPACGTLFRVLPDQLKVSSGWVRCGCCADVFDATQHQFLLELDMPSPASLASQAQAQALAEPVVEPSADLMDHDATDAGGRPALSPDGSIPVLAEPAEAQTALEQPVPADASPFDDPREEPGFVRRARLRAFWRSSGVRAVLGLLALVLAGLMLAQLALHHRDQLAATQPVLAPWLAKACESLGCSIAPVRRIDAVMIDSTALVRQLDGGYTFDIVLKNTAAMPLAMPALELTLTHLGDAVLARRVFLPSELAGAPGLLPAQASIPLSLRLSLAVAEVSSMEGYRALVFYP